MDHGPQMSPGPSRIGRVGVQESQYPISANDLQCMQQHALKLAREQIKLDIHSHEEAPEEDKPRAKESILKVQPKAHATNTKHLHRVQLGIRRGLWPQSV